MTTISQGQKKPIQLYPDMGELNLIIIEVTLMIQEIQWFLKHWIKWDYHRK